MARRDAGVTRPRERILDAATAHFSESGIHVGINAIGAEARVTATTLYRHFESKDHLVAAAAERWGAQWLRWLEDKLDRAGPAATRREALVEALEEWFASEGFRGSLVTNAAVALRSEPDHPAQPVIAAHRARLRQLLEDVVGPDAPTGAADELQLLIDGATLRAQVDHRPGGLRRAA
jgi:AcrR family transcriptional regulator